MGAPVTMKQLLEAGVHFGHQTRRWNPQMKQFIFQERNGIYILDLQQTLGRIEVAFEFVKKLSSDGGMVLFVGTKKQASDSIEEEARRCGMYFVNQRWLGGMITNFQTLRSRIERLADLEQQEADGELDKLSKKELKKIRTELTKLRRYLGGVRGMLELPQALFIVDLKKENIAFLEARKAGIPIVAVVDTNCDPTGVDYPIPGNDDAIRAVRLLCTVVADAVIQGRQQIEVTEETFEREEEEVEAGQDEGDVPKTLPAVSLDEPVGEPEGEAAGGEGGESGSGAEQ